MSNHDLTDVAIFSCPSITADARKVLVGIPTNRSWIICIAHCSICLTLTKVCDIRAVLSPGVLWTVTLIIIDKRCACCILWTRIWITHVDYLKKQYWGGYYAYRLHRRFLWTLGNNHIWTLHLLDLRTSHSNKVRRHTGRRFDNWPLYKCLSIDTYSLFHSNLYRDLHSNMVWTCKGV